MTISSHIYLRVMCVNNYRLKAVFCVFAIAAFFTAFFVEPSTMINGVSNGLSLCAAAIVPSLFPFMVLSDFMVRSRLVEIIGRYLKPVTKLLFNLPGSAGCAVLMSMVGGYPTGAKMTTQLLENGSISKSQAKRMMLFCVNAGPAFVMGTVGTAIFSDHKVGIILYVSMVIASLSIGIFSRIFEIGSLELKEKNIEFESGIVPVSIMQGINTTLFLCAWVLIFSCINALIESLPLHENILSWIKMFTEVTNGCVSASVSFPVSIQALIMGWAGLSVHCQLSPYIKQTQVKYLHFVLSRIIHGGLSATVADFLFRVFPCDTSVFSTNTDVLPKIYSVSIPSAVATVILALMLVAELSFRSQNKNDEI